MNATYLPVLLFIPSLGASFYFGYTPLLVSVFFAVFSILAFAFYYKDKSSAVRGSWRTPESTLHLLSLMCGWPGAIVAQQKLRHKTQKMSFRLVFWLTVIINVSAFSWLHTVDGSKLLRSYVSTINNQLVYNFGSYDVSKYLLTLTKFHTARKD